MPGNFWRVSKLSLTGYTFSSLFYTQPFLLFVNSNYSAVVKCLIVLLDRFVQVIIQFRISVVNQRVETEGEIPFAVQVFKAIA